MDGTEKDIRDGKRKIGLTIPVIVEGRYDKARLAGVVDAVILTTDGFAVFRNGEKRALIRRLGGRGVILLSDSDGGGRLIRSRLKGMLDGIPVYDLYTPVLRGKEPRKKAQSKAGILGVEGVPDGILRELFEKFAAAHPECAAAEPSSGGSAEGAEKKKTPVTKALLFELGLNGGPGASALRAAAAERLGLPADMTVNAFCAAADMISDGDELAKIAEEIGGTKAEPL